MNAHAIQTEQSVAAAARVLWLLRWLLVLVLAWEQVSAPLHHHGHASGVDVQWLTASAHDAPATALHLECDDHDPRASHVVLAVRPRLDLDSFTLGADPDHSFAHGQVPPLSELVPAAAPAPAITAPARPHSTHRSLPPAGRAPPLHT
ncbi:MAG: hypothetical protein ACYC0T_10735 [Ramlibacter sp.]